GTITLAGDFTIKDTTSTLQQVELEARKDSIQAKAKTDLANALGTLSIEKALPKESPQTMSFKATLGSYDITIDYSKRVGSFIKVKGSISNEQSMVNKSIDGQEIKGKLSLEFDLTLEEMMLQEALSYGVLTKQVFSTVAISAVSAAAITAAPILVVAGASAVATGASTIGATVIARAIGLATIFNTATASYA
ncbi:MAG: hypothetical protein PQJ44_10355, partial [Sphaerochaetaceae bacterium]|nr:hypothetical protein [Sphaerochaetaceae bacterium]